MIACDILRFFSPFLNGIGWLLATLIGALVGIWVAGYLDRRKLIYAAQTEVLKILDSCPDSFLDQYLSQSIETMRGPLFTAIPYLRERDQERATKAWNALKPALDDKTHGKDEFMESVNKFLGVHVESKEDAFRRVFEDINTTLASSSHLIN
jgi:hypothetical protein